MSFNLIKFHEMRYSANEYRYVEATYVETLKRYGWTDRGPIFHAFLNPSTSDKDTNIVPIYAYKNTTYNSSGYRYVSKPDVDNGAVSSGWKFVGVAFHAFRNAERGSLEVRTVRVANPWRYRLVPEGMNVGSGYSSVGDKFHAIPYNAQLAYNIIEMNFTVTKMEDVTPKNLELQSQWQINNNSEVEQRHEETYEKSYTSSMSLSWTNHFMINAKGTFTPPSATGGFGAEVSVEYGHSGTKTHIDGIKQTFNSLVSINVAPCRKGTLTASMFIDKVDADFVAKVEVTGNSSISGALSSKLVGYLLKEDNPEIDFEVDEQKDAVDVELTGKFTGTYGTRFYQSIETEEIPGCTPAPSDD
jgi:hypothetical protein